MKRTYVITYAVWALFAIAAAAEAGRLGFGTFGRPGPGFLPFLAAIGLGGLAIAGMVQTTAAERAAAERVEFKGRDILKIGLVTAVLFGYVLLWDLIGFVTSTFLLLVFLFRCVEPLRWRNVFVAAGLTLAFTYFLFSTLLGARLPAGRLWTYLIN